MKNNVDTVFGYTGGAILPVTDIFYIYKRISLLANIILIFNRSTLATLVNGRSHVHFFGTELTTIIKRTPRQNPAGPNAFSINIASRASCKTLPIK